MLRLTRAQNILVLLALLSVSIVPAGVLASAAPPLQGGNLLENPGFDGSSGTECPAYESDGDIKVAEGWTPWWIDAGDEDYIDRASFYCEANDTQFIKEGPTSQFIRHEWTTGAAGIYQTVGGIPEDSRVRFSVWGKSYSCHDDGGVCTTALAGYLGMQVGIDPNGGTNFYADSVKDTPGTSAPDWAEFVIEADVPGGSTPVTVFIAYYPDWPLQRNQVWWDVASLTVIGDAQGDTGSTGNTNSPPPPADAKFVTPEPPGPDGSVVHTVEKGDTLAAIAVAYSRDCCPDITIPKIKELNNLSSDIIYVGQKLTILEASSAPPPPAETPVPEETEEADVEETPEPPPVTEEPAPTGGQICMSIFEDANGNTIMDPEEFLLAGASLTVKNDATGFSDSYTTDGATEPHCFTQLTPGEYIAEAIPPAGYAMTSVNPWSIQVEATSDLTVPFAAALSDEPVVGPDDDTGGKSGGSGNLGRILAALGGLAVLAIAGGLAAYFFVFRRNT